MRTSSILFAHGGAHPGTGPDPGAATADRCAATESHIVIFNRTGKTNWKEQVFTNHGEHDGIPIKIWGM